MYLFLAHGLGDGKGVALNASNKAVAELTLSGALIEGLHNDGLLAGKASLEEDDDFAGLDKLVLLLFLAHD
jgi:hypothetical protein